MKAKRYNYSNYEVDIEKVVITEIWISEIVHFFYIEFENKQEGAFTKGKVLKITWTISNI